MVLRATGLPSFSTRYRSSAASIIVSGIRLSPLRTSSCSKSMTFSPKANVCIASGCAAGAESVAGVAAASSLNHSWRRSSPRTRERKIGSSNGFVR